MIDVIFTDTHFGWKNNSMTWLNSQMDFIYKQFIPEIKALKYLHGEVRVIHCGDVFDSRSTIGTYVASKVVQAFKDIRSVCDEFVILCGNHDFYSPNSDTVNTVKLFMSHLNIDIVDQEVLVRDNHAFVPWYAWQNTDLEVDADYIFCHADLTYESIPIMCTNKTLIAGHIHTPKYDEKRGRYNLGSCYSLNFSDSNQKRGYYIFKDGQLAFEPNTVSINFYRIRGIDVLQAPTYNPEDYIELYVPQEDLSKQEYIDAIKEYSLKYRHLWVVPVVAGLKETELLEFGKYDINTMIDELIPDDLQDMYKQIKKKLKL